MDSAYQRPKYKLPQKLIKQIMKYENEWKKKQNSFP